MPSSWRARITRTAISPRLATRTRLNTRRSLARERRGERTGAAAQHGLAVRDEDARHRQLQHRRERLAQVVVRGTTAQPSLRAHTQLLVGGLWLGSGAEQDVADNECSLPWQPVDDLARP